MKRLFFIILILSMSIVVGNNIHAESSLVISNNHSEKDKIQLFNGENLDRWYTFLKDKGRDNDPNKVFTVEEGILRISGEEFGCITTNDEYDNYKLIVEFKWGDVTYAPRLEKARDSGILMHSIGEDGGSGGIWMNSIECQIIEGGTADFIVVGDGTPSFSITSPVAPEKQSGSYVYKTDGDLVTIYEGRINWFNRDSNWKDVKGFRGAADIENTVGEWNKIECISQDGELFIYLNSKLVNYAVNVEPQKGRIQIQSEGAEIFFRRIDLTPLTRY